MTMEKQPFEDVSPVKKGCFSTVMLVFEGVSWMKKNTCGLCWGQVWYRNQCSDSETLIDLKKT